MKLEELYDSYFDEKVEGQAYESEEAYREDLFCFLDILLTVACSMKYADWEEEGILSIENMHLRGVAVTASEVLRALLDNTLDAKSHVQNFRMKDIREILNKARCQIAYRIQKTEEDGKIFRLRMLYYNFQLSEFEYFLLLLGISNYYDTKYEVIYAYLQGDIRMKLPSFRLARSLFELYEQLDGTEAGRAVSGHRVLYEVLLEKQEIYDNIKLAQVYTLKMRAFAWLEGYREIEKELEGYVTWYSCGKELEPVLVWQMEYENLVRILNDEAENNDAVFNIYGPRGNGRRFLVKQVSKALRRDVLFVDFDHLSQSTKEEQDKIMALLYSETMLLNSLLCFYSASIGNGKSSAEEKETLIKGIITFFGRRIEHIIWISEEKADYLMKYDIRYFCIELPMLSIKERILAWKNFSEQYDMEGDVDFNMIGSQYLLTMKGIKDVLWNADRIRMCEGKDKISKKNLIDAVKQQSVNQLGQSARLVKTVYTWDDLILGEDTVRQLHMICDQMKYKSLIGEEWGFYEKTSYGKGVCAMFYGAPGTGKTMAVQVIANELGLNLYRIDLSQIVSKYIGETEKNITRLFERARGIHALLFFDEADSLFARRCEVKDSMDRSANAQTAHLLQEIEDYEGITILATNYANNMDDAFKRRIKFMVKFMFPDEAVRLRLWKSIMPETVPCEEKIDFAFFARKFELSGSSIKEILTLAAFMAASEHRNLTNRHVVEAIKLNYAKYGKNMTNEEFGYLG